jgi:hypothetical protein
MKYLKTINKLWEYSQSRQEAHYVGNGSGGANTSFWYVCGSYAILHLLAHMTPCMGSESSSN